MQTQGPRYVDLFVREIIDDCDLLDDMTVRRCREPLGVNRVVLYIYGQLSAADDRLAKDGNEYPFLKWDPQYKRCEIGATGKLDFELDSKFTAELADGVTFTPERHEMWSGN